MARVICTIVFLLTCLTAAAMGHNGDVLVLHSYHQGHPCSDNPTKGIRDVFRDKKPDNDIHMEYLDAKRFAGDQYYNDLYRFFRNKYGKTRFEVIISSDDNAFRFLLEYGDKLFPGVPVVFCGLNYYTEKMLEGRHELFTGVVEATDARKTVDAALKLRPQTRKIVVVNDRTETGEANRKAITDIIPEYKNRVEFVFYEDLLVADLLNKIKQLSTDSAILYLTFNQDTSGASIDQFEFLKRISQISSVPMYSLWDVSLGYGTVGGMLTSGYDQGKIAAEMAVRILNGEKPKNIPVVTNVQNRYEFDYNQLKRFRIAMNDLPKGSRIHNKPVSVYGEHKAYLLTAISIIAVLISFIALLISNVTKRKLAEETLHKTNRALKVLSSCNEAMIRATEESELLANICRIIATEGNYCFCWVGYLQQSEGGLIRPVAYAGTDSGYLDAVEVFLRKSEFEQGPSGTAIKTGQPAIIRDIKTDPDYALWRDEALKRGFASLISLPLSVEPRQSAALAIFSDNPDSFNAEEVKLLKELANDLSFGITTLRASKERERSEHLISNIFKNMGEGLAVIDRDFKISAANTAYCNLHNRSRDDVLGKRCYEVVLNMDKPCDEIGKTCPVRQSFATGESAIKIDVISDKNVGPKHVEVTSYPITDDYGRITSVVEISRNITDRKKLEEQLRLAQKMEAIGTLAGGIAHDFNNILTAIIGYANLLQMEVDDDGPLMSDLDSIVAAVNKAANLTDSLLAYSRREAIDPSPMELNKIVEKVDVLLSRLIRKDIETVTKLADEKLTIMADGGQIEQVLMNFATNARDAMPGGGQLVIGTAKVEMDDEFIRAHGFGEVGVYALLSVSDTGKGMDEKTMERIFEPFFTTKERGKGTGLGLSVVYGIVKQHHGYINVYSEPEHGTTFNVYIPLTELDEEETEIERHFPVRRGTETVLLAEDTEEVRQMMKDTLVRFGYKVIEAVDGEDAVTIYEQNRSEIQLLIIDIIMPKKNGKEVYDEIRKTNPAMKAIFISGYTADIINKKGIAEERQNFLSKPFTSNKLLAKIREVMGE